MLVVWIQPPSFWILKIFSTQLKIAIKYFLHHVTIFDESNKLAINIGQCTSVEPLDGDHQNPKKEITNEYQVIIDAFKKNTTSSFNFYNTSNKQHEINTKPGNNDDKKNLETNLTEFNARLNMLENKLNSLESKKFDTNEEIYNLKKKQQ